VTEMETYVVAALFCSSLPIGIAGLITGLCLRKEVDQDTKANMIAISLSFAIIAVCAAGMVDGGKSRSILPFAICLGVFLPSVFTALLAVGLLIRNYKYS